MSRTPREQAIAALTGGEPHGLVPTFELEFQLTEEFFGRPWYGGGAFAGLSATERDRLLGQLAEDYIAMWESLDYSILMEVRTPDDDTRIELLNRIRAQVGDRWLFICHGDATYSIPDGGSMVDFTVRLFEQPDEVKRQADAWVDAALEHGRQLIDRGLDGFALCADYCFNTGPFLSPPMFAEFVTPFLARLVAGYKEMGAYVIKHTDGNIMPILDDLVSCAPHGLHSIDPQGGVDLAEVKARCGDRICLLGGVNCGLLQTGSDEACRADLLRALRAGMPGGRYVFCTSNVAFKGMPKERYQMLLDVRREFGRYD
jgi:uroporphyrinogen decarboxylase